MHGLRRRTYESSLWELLSVVAQKLFVESKHDCGTDTQELLVFPSVKVYVRKEEQLETQGRQISAAAAAIWSSEWVVS